MRNVAFFNEISINKINLIIIKHSYSSYCQHRNSIELRGSGPILPDKDASGKKLNLAEGLRNHFFIYKEPSVFAKNWA
jgi:hypothetical protein